MSKNTSFQKESASSDQLQMKQKAGKESRIYITYIKISFLRGIYTLEPLDLDNTVSCLSRRQPEDLNL